MKRNKIGKVVKQSTLSLLISQKLFNIELIEEYLKKDTSKIKHMSVIGSQGIINNWGTDYIVVHNEQSSFPIFPYFAQHFASKF